MNDPGERVLQELQRIKGEIEELVQATLDGIGEQAGNALKHLQASIGHACEQASDTGHALHGQFRHSARQTDRYVHDNAWLAVAVAAGAAFILGVVAARRLKEY